MRDRFALSAADRVLAVTTIGFDIAALELYLPLLSGASVAVADGDTVKDPAALLRAVGGERRDGYAGDADAVAGAGEPGSRTGGQPRQDAADRPLVDACGCWSRLARRGCWWRRGAERLLAAWRSSRASA